MPDRDPLTGIPPSRHPFQTWALFACLFAGTAAAFDFGQPATLRTLMPVFMVRVWGLCLMFGGGLGLAAGYWKDRITGLLIERIALLAVGGPSALYGICLYVIAGNQAYTASTFCVSIGLAAFWRTRHVNRELKVLMRWIARR